MSNTEHPKSTQGSVGSPEDAFRAVGLTLDTTLSHGPIDYTLPGCTCAMGGMGRRADCPHHGERRVGRFGFRFDSRFGQVQTYTDGAPVHEGDHVIHTQAPGGLLHPTSTTGIASFCPWGNEGELYVRYSPNGFDQYAHMNGGVVRDLTVDA